MQPSSHTVPTPDTCAHTCTPLPLSPPLSSPLPYMSACHRPPPPRPPPPHTHTSPTPHHTCFPATPYMYMELRAPCPSPCMALVPSLRLHAKQSMCPAPFLSPARPSRGVEAGWGREKGRRAGERRAKERAVAGPERAREPEVPRQGGPERGLRRCTALPASALDPDNTERTLQHQRKIKQGTSGKTQEHFSRCSLR